MTKYYNRTVRLADEDALNKLKSELINGTYNRMSMGRAVEIAIIASVIAVQKGTVDKETVIKIAQGKVSELKTQY